MQFYIAIVKYLCKIYQYYINYTQYLVFLIAYANDKLFIAVNYIVRKLRAKLHTSLIF